MTAFLDPLLNSCFQPLIIAVKHSIFEMAGFLDPRLGFFCRESRSLFWFIYTVTVLKIEEILF